jgi:ribonuclease HI
MKTVHIFTDGSCRGNPGPGGWAFLLCYVDTQGHRHERVESGAVPHTTNHRMALEAVIQGLAALCEPCRVERSTDSEDVLMRLNGGGARKHLDSVQRLQAAAIHQVTPHDVHSHAGHPENECVDAFAQQAASTGVGKARRRGLTCHWAATWPVALVCTVSLSGLGARIAS